MCGGFLSREKSMYKGIKQHVCVIGSYHCIKNHPKTQWLKPIIIISHGLVGLWAGGFSLGSVGDRLHSMCVLFSSCCQTH